MDIPELPFSPRNCVQRPFSLTASCGISRSEVEERQSLYKEVLDDLQQKNPAMLLFSTTNLICTGQQCSVIVEGRSYCKDSHHLSSYGSNLVGRAFINWARVNSLKLKLPNQ